jgi:23S rRNA (guanine745-N1)-methyltransferase
MVDASVDLLFDMFGFPNYASFLKVLTPRGRLVRLTPGDRHLIQLREIIYPNIKSPSERSSYPEILRVVAEKRITYEMTLGPEDLNNLLLMTPHMFRSTPDRRQQALNHDQLSLTVDVFIEELIATTA